MRRLAALMLAVFYLLSSNLCFAFSEMYYLKNVDYPTVSTLVKNTLTEKNYGIKKESPYFATLNDNRDKYVVVILQPNGQDMYYYVQADDSGKSFNKEFLKALKKQNIAYDEYNNTTYMDYFSELAKKTISGEKTVYSFDQVAGSGISSSPAKTSLSNPKVLQGTVKKVGKGSAMDIYLQHAINTATANEGDSVTAVLKNSWVADSYMIAPQGSLLYGNLTKAEHAKMGMRNGYVQIDFNKLITPDGKTYNLVTQKIDFEVTNEGKVKSSITKVATATALGALVGLGLALLTGDSKGASAAIGAGVAGGVVLVSSVAAKGVDAEIPSYTELQVVVDEDIKAVVNY